MPIEQPRPVSRSIAALHAPCRGLRALEPGQVEIRLVEADDLHAVDVRAQDVHHGAGALPVELEVGRDEHRIRTEAACA